MQPCGPACYPPEWRQLAETVLRIRVCFSNFATKVASNIARFGSQDRHELRQQDRQIRWARSPTPRAWRLATLAYLALRPEERFIRRLHLSDGERHALAVQPS